MRNYEDRPAAYDLDMSERNFSCAWDRTTHTPAGQILVLSPFLMLLLFARLISKRVARDDRPLRMPPGMPLRSRQPESRRHFFGTGGRVPFVNDVVSRFGYLPDDVRGEPIIAIVPPDDCVAAMNRVNERRTGERRTRALEVRLVPDQSTTGGSSQPNCTVAGQRYFLVDAEGLYANGAGAGQFVGTHCVVRDVTDRKRLELELLQSQKLEAIGRPTVGHPVSARLQTMRSAFVRPGWLTKQLIAFARKRASEPRTVEVNQSISERIELVDRLTGDGMDADTVTHLFEPSYTSKPIGKEMDDRTDRPTAPLSGARRVR